ncbi:hypothetical protein AB1Y20_015180 [Prymnesium parvum]|uniref:Uncharacterized protein n=1 Tax=Prymnesium parvum TaxID=97485 RepID=A0AB34JX33_PRYPA
MRVFLLLASISSVAPSTSALLPEPSELADATLPDLIATLNSRFTSEEGLIVRTLGNKNDQAGMTYENVMTEECAKETRNFEDIDGFLVSASWLRHDLPIQVYELSSVAHGVILASSVHRGCSWPRDSASCHEPSAFEQCNATRVDEYIHAQFHQLNSHTDLHQCGELVKNVTPCCTTEWSWMAQAKRAMIMDTANCTQYAGLTHNEVRVNISFPAVEAVFYIASQSPDSEEVVMKQCKKARNGSLALATGANSSKPLAVVQMTVPFKLSSTGSGPLRQPLPPKPLFEAPAC